MKYATSVAFRQALETRLKAHANATGLSLDRLRKGVVFERFLARMLVTVTDPWILKGGSALDLRFGAAARTTRDVDLGRAGNPDQATEDLLAAAATDLGDFFVFAVERTDALDVVLEGAAVRYRLTVDLAGRRFEQVVVDVGFGDLPLQPDILAAPDLLAFADIESILIPSIPRGKHAAEKVHAYARVYGIAGHFSTRVKDLVDLVIVSAHSSLEAGTIRDAVHTTFDLRGTQPPEVLPHPPEDWRVPYRRLAAAVGIDTELDTGHALAAAFVDPVLQSALANDAVWSPNERIWRKPD